MFTVAESAQVCRDILGLHCKNLLLTEKKGTRKVLVVMPASARLDMKLLRRQIDSRPLTFVSEEEMQKLIKLQPGHVSPLGLIHDADNIVELYIDRRVWEADTVGFHPNKNDATLEIRHEEFVKILDALGNEWRVVDVVG